VFGLTRLEGPSAKYNHNAYHNKQPHRQAEYMAIRSKAQAPNGQSKFVPINYSSDGMIYDDFTIALIARAEQRFKKRLREWQAASVDWLGKGNDLFVRAGCNAGKTLVGLAMTAAKEGKGSVLILAPLKSLIQTAVTHRTQLILILDRGTEGNEHSGGVNYTGNSQKRSVHLGKAQQRRIPSSVRHS
jgi:hypothetical protein